MADQHLVTGISPDAEPKKIEDALCARPQVDCSKVHVITGDPPTEEHTTSILQFIHSSEYAQTSDVSHDVIRGDTAIMTEAGGVNVPGISSDTRYLGFFAQPHIIGHLADWPIPEDQIQNYNDAIEAGRAVVTYKAEPSEAPQVEQAFKDAGLKNVKTFESTDTAQTT
ncbi:MAG: hypothetical protein JOZ59_01210 [Candidatus Eremiobacteraeota bacterium]|nr:hypothetical protein [Candidatus Eremiobacteraeota bacterium]MBV9276655.1 hypothetical protein [Candidatus Eremiobacteraeota bacterium]